MPASTHAASATRREVLPQTRRSLTHKFAINGHEGYLTIGLFEDGRPGEIFIKMSKEGSTLSGLIQGFCRAFSLTLPHGLPAADAAERKYEKAKEAAARATKAAEEGGVRLEDVADLPENRRELRVEEQTESPFDTEDDAP